MALGYIYVMRQLLGGQGPLLFVCPLDMPPSGRLAARAGKGLARIDCFCSLCRASASLIKNVIIDYEKVF